ncbi:MAG: lipoyl synthase [Candidatus Hodarchaeales archaeon]
MQGKPNWIKTKLPTDKEYGRIRKLLRKQKLHTVCEEAFCPNCTECWESGTATFLLMGSFCTRRCKFCDIQTRNPRQYLDSAEPNNLASVVNQIGLKYVVLTSVTRDDLDDGGATHISQCIKKIKEKNPEIIIEMLIPDFQGNSLALKKIVESKPDVIGHNIETTEVLTPLIRDGKASFKQSIAVLKRIKEFNPEMPTKSSLMLGFGETDEDVVRALNSLKNADVDIVTIGQYLQPSRKHLAVIEFIPPEKFDFWEKIAREMGFLHVLSGPLVRSSYRAGELFIDKNLSRF